MMSEHKLTDLQERFCEEYLVDLNATRAAERAGSSAKNLTVAGSEFLANPNVSERIVQLKAERANRTKVDADWVLNQSVILYQRCMNDISVFTDRKGDPILDENGELQYVFNSTGAAKAIELVGKHVGVGAFKDKVELSGPNGGPVEITHTARDRVAERLAGLAGKGDVEDK